jgi:phage terminase large subunit-like protein
MMFPVDGQFKMLPYFWVPEAAVKKRSEHNQPFYADWVRRGLLRTTPGKMTDYAVIRKEINELAEMYPIREIAVDRTFQGAQLACELGQDGFEVVSFAQGFAPMASPTLAFETAMKAGKLEHGGNKVLRWMAANVAVEIDTGGRMRPYKAESADKIDGIVCGVMAMGRLAEMDDGLSVYDTRGPVWV